MYLVGTSTRLGKACLSGAVQLASYEETKASTADYFSTIEAK